MPPKKGVAKQYSVYIVVQERYCDHEECDRPESEAKKVTVISVHATLEMANKDAKTCFQNSMADMLLMNRDLIQPVLDSDGAATYRWDGEISYDEVRVVCVPFSGGSIAVSGSRKKTLKKGSSRFTTTSEHETVMSLATDEDDEVQGPPVTPAAVAKSAAKAGLKRKIMTDLDQDDDDELDSSPPPHPADAEPHFAPGGYAGCLSGWNFLISGSLDPWTRVQAQALIEEFGGICLKNLKPEVDYLILGAKPGTKMLDELNDAKYNDVERISQSQLYALISSTRGDGSDIYKSKEYVTDVCNRAKQPAKKRAKKVAT